MVLVLENEKALKEKHDKVERILQEREKELEYKSMSPVVQSGELTLVQAMAQVSLKKCRIDWFEKQEPDPREPSSAKRARKENLQGQIPSLGGQMLGAKDK